MLYAFGVICIIWCIFCFYFFLRVAEEAFNDQEIQFGVVFITVSLLMLFFAISLVYYVSRDITLDNVAKGVKYEKKWDGWHESKPEEPEEVKTINQ